ncbi:E3 ubiquitin-protein ligase RNF26 [Osmerus mordax]|uniref:E3 ubiquitin-protein ligase RNF26 n=1 Tax=Osmerus mordax TaxID=8014 RepID=UPI0035107A8D
MGLVNLVFSTVSKCIEVIGFLLDLNFVIVHSLIRLVVASIAFVNNLPMLLANLVVQCCQFVLSCLVYLAESAAVLAQGTVSMLGSVLESLKMMGHLSSHVCLRGRALLQRGALSVCDGCGIAVNLAVYLVNSVVNMFLIGSQNVYYGAVSVWQAVSSPLQKVLELGMTLLAFLYSSLSGTTMLLWTPCSLALEYLFLLAHFLISTFILNVYGLLLTASITLATTLYLHPEITRRGAQTAAIYLNSIPMLRGLPGSLWRLQRAVAQLPGALRLLQRVLLDMYWQERDRWERLSRQGSRLGQSLGSRLRQGLGHRDRRIGGDGDQGQGGAEDAEQRAPPDGRAAGGPPREHPGPRHQQDNPSSSRERPLWKLSGPGLIAMAGPGSADGLLSLLKEQEERKKCVICQDCSKTVVLLPCRHLCLCKDCTSILLRQPIYLQNCPLCRHMILNTMDVYM